MIVETSRRGDVVFVEITGRVDSVTAPKLQTVVEGVIAQKDRKVVVDMRRLEFVSSAGLRVLLLLAKQMKALSGKVAFVQGPEAVMSVLKLSGFLAMLVVKPTMAEAMAAVQ
jgi:anti-anti-sigma factor